MTPGEPKVTGAPPTDLHNYAHFGDGWYFCWLIERRDGPQPQWWSVGCEWTTDAWKALWYARREDADADADECPHDVVVCEHGFAVTGEDKTFDHAALSTRVRELEAALAKYGDHYPECSVIQECGHAVKPPCNCGYTAIIEATAP